MIILLLFAFLAGLLTILAPCVWPLLPVLLSTDSVAGGKKRPLGLVTGIAVSFGALTLLASYLEKYLGINENYLRYFSVIFLIVLGVILVVPHLSQKYEAKMSAIVGRFAPKPNANSTGFKGGFLTGLGLGILWTPCSGPIFAAVATESTQAKFSFGILLVAASYLLGVSIPLYWFVIGGQRVIKKSRVFNKHLGKFQILSGAILIVFAIASLFGWDKTAEIWLLNRVPSYTSALQSIERTSAVHNQLSKLTSNGKSITNQSNTSSDNSSYFNVPPGSHAPDFVGISSWINSAPLTMAQLKGKVVLVDFWTYSCINCIRSLQYVTKWYNTYHKYGFVVVGVHSPEFPFEKERGNVIAATKQFGIKYPVAQDNDLATWNNYNNEYWPAEYVIDAKGDIRRTEFGEGGYAETEKAIQILLAQNGVKVNSKVSDPLNVNYQQGTSLETYLGTARESQDQNPYQVITPLNSHYLTPKTMQPNTFALSGDWNISSDHIAGNPGAQIIYDFVAHQVYIILRPHQVGAVDYVDVKLDGKPIPAKVAGTDVINGRIKVDEDRLYNLFDSKTTFSNNTISITFENKGTQAYTFTFG